MKTGTQVSRSPSLSSAENARTVDNGVAAGGGIATTT
jgi:hypothetical protein